MKLILFDIDGTLVLTGGAGVRAMTRACDELLGGGEALDGIPVAGRTDWVILQDASSMRRCSPRCANAIWCGWRRRSKRRDTA